MERLPWEITKMAKRVKDIGFQVPISKGSQGVTGLETKKLISDDVMEVGVAGKDEREGRIRVGRDYQAVPPPFIHSSDRRPEQCAERALLVWSPANHIAGQKLDEFIQVA